MSWTLTIELAHIIQGVYGVCLVWALDAGWEAYQSHGARHAAEMTGFFLVVTWLPLTVALLAIIGLIEVVA